MIDANVTSALLRLCRAIHTPWVGAKRDDIVRGKGKIAAAYRAADALNESMGLVPEKHATVTRIPRRVH